MNPGGDSYQSLWPVGCGGFPALVRFLLDLLPRLDNVDFSALSELEQRMLQMFYVTVWGKAARELEIG